MLKIEPTPGGKTFTVRISEPGLGRGLKVEAKTLRAVSLCVNHYYGKRHNGNYTRGCPFCDSDKRKNWAVQAAGCVKL